MERPAEEPSIGSGARWCGIASLLAALLVGYAALAAAWATVTVPARDYSQVLHPGAGRWLLVACASVAGVSAVSYALRPTRLAAWVQLVVGIVAVATTAVGALGSIAAANREAMRLAELTVTAYGPGGALAFLGSFALVALGAAEVSMATRVATRAAPVDASR